MKLTVASEFKMKLSYAKVPCPFVSSILPFHQCDLNHNFRHIFSLFFKNPSSIKTIMNSSAKAQSQVLRETQVDLKKLKRINYLLSPTPCLSKIEYSKKIYVSGI